MERNERKSNSRAHTMTVDRESKFLVRKIIMDFGVLSCIAFLILVFSLWGTPYKRGFFCDDESLKHPYKDSTVTNLMMYIVNIGLPVITMALTEWLRLRDYKGRPRTIFGKEIATWIWEVYSVVGVYLFGMACQQLTTDIAKYTIGRLRPHFFDVCKPDIDCSLPENRWRYIEEFTCNNTSPSRRLKEMRLSFPSGHSSFSAYSMVYFGMYIQQRFTWRGSKLLRHGIQFLLMMFAWYTCMSRVSDYKHHWSDVLAGIAIGLIYAVVVFTFISNLRKSTRHRLPNHEAELHVTNGNSRSAAGWQV